MKFQPILLCKKDLDFAPKEEGSHLLPPLVWRGQILWGFQHPYTEALVLEDQSPLELIFKKLYPALSPEELSRLVKKLKNTQYRATIPELLKTYEIYDIESTMELCQWISQLPMTVQQWTQSRQFTFGHFKSIRPLKPTTIDDLAHWFTKLITLRASQSLAIKCLELAVELKGLGQEPSMLLENSKNADEAYQALSQARYPKSYSWDEMQNQKVKALAWPLHVQPRWMRQGDTGALEIRLKATGEKDIEKQIQGLSKLLPQIKEQFRKLHS